MKLFVFFFLITTLCHTAPGKPIRVGLVLDKGGKDDKSFNTAAYKGATEAEKKYGVQLKTVETSDDVSIEPSIRTFAQKGFNLVIGIGFAMQSGIRKVASEFPDTHFLLIDSEVDLPNVRSITYQEHEGGYLAGAIAALSSQTKTIGFVGGMDVPLIRRFELGYRAGAKAVVPNVTVITNYVGSTSDAWRNPTKGKELALSQYQKKVDIIFAAAGASGLGVFDAAEEQNKFAIGVDSNQNWVKPGKILTSIIKRIDLGVISTIDAEVNNKFKGGISKMGVSENSIDFTIDEHNRKLVSPETEKKANEIKTKMIQKKITVPDYYEVGKKG